MVWSKSVDWLPLMNAEAQVNFWKEDLRQAEMYVKTVRSYKKYNFKFYRKILTFALRDVALSRKELAMSIHKLIATRKRVLRSK